MNAKAVQRCCDVVASSLTPGERIEAVEVAQIGKVSAKKQAGAAAVGVAVGVATGGLVPLIAVKPAAFFLVVTDQRLLLIPNNAGRVGKQVTAAIPRRAITMGPLRTHVLTLSMGVVMDGVAHRFSWGRIGGMKQARGVIAATGGVVA